MVTRQVTLLLSGADQQDSTCHCRSPIWQWISLCLGFSGSVDYICYNTRRCFTWTDLV